MLQWMISSFSPVTLNWQLSSSGFQSIILNRSWFGSKIDSKNFNSAFSPETDIFYSSQTTRPLAEGKSGRNVTAQLSRVYGSRMLAWEQQQWAEGWGSCIAWKRRRNPHVSCTVSNSNLQHLLLYSGKDCYIFLYFLFFFTALFCYWCYFRPSYVPSWFYLMEIL